MPFGVNNGLATYQRVVSRTFKDYLNKFMKFFWDDFIVYNDMDIHLLELGLCFQKCREFGISLNLFKCAFMIFLGMILGFIVSKEGKLPNLEKI
jgi:hypothetical protein